MYPERRPARQKGIGLVAAIFVITVMALISVGLSNLVVTGQQSYGHEVLSARAFLAAESGAQLNITQVVPPSGTGSCPATSTPELKASGLQGCTVSVDCTAVGPIDSVTYYTIESEGRCGVDASADLAIRRVTMRIQVRP